MTTVRSRDGCVVATDQLSGLLQGFVTDWNRQRPETVAQSGSKSSRGEVSMVSALDWLAQESGVGASTIKNLLPQGSTGRPRYRHTELRIADAVVGAIGHPEAWHNGTLEIVKNPSATQAAQAACCSGSLTGSTP